VAAAAFLWISAANGATTYVSASLLFSPNPPVGLDVGSLVFSIDEMEIRYSAYVTTTADSIDIVVGDALSFTADVWTDITLGGSIIPIGDGLYLTQPVLRSFRLFEGVVEDQELADLLRSEPEQSVSVDFGSVTPATGNLAAMNVPEPSTLSLILPLAACMTLRRRRSKNRKPNKTRLDNPLPAPSRDAPGD
jgi:hypothetical protein